MNRGKERFSDKVIATYRASVILFMFVPTTLLFVLISLVNAYNPPCPTNVFWDFLDFSNVDFSLYYLLTCLIVLHHCLFVFPIPFFKIKTVGAKSPVRFNRIQDQRKADKTFATEHKLIQRKTRRKQERERNNTEQNKTEQNHAGQPSSYISSCRSDLTL